MAAPSFIQEAEATTWANATTPKTTASFNVVLNDILVAFAVAASWNQGALSISSNNGLVWTPQQTIYLNNYTALALWTAVADTTEAMTVSFASTVKDGGSDMWFGGNCLTFRDSDGVGATTKTNATTAAPTLNVTTTQDNSALVVVVGDWNATDGASRAWRAINSITPTAANGYERSYHRDSSNYGAYGAYYPDAGSIAVKAVGLTAPTMKYSIATVEVKGTAGTPPADVVHAFSLMGVGA